MAIDEQVQVEMCWLRRRKGKGFYDRILSQPNEEDALAVVRHSKVFTIQDLMMHLVILQCFQLGEEVFEGLSLVDCLKTFDVFEDKTLWSSGFDVSQTTEKQSAARIFCT